MTPRQNKEEKDFLKGGLADVSKIFQAVVDLHPNAAPAAMLRH